MNKSQDLNRVETINRLTAFREMWDCAAENLVEINASVGLLLADLLVVLDLDEQEQAEILGPRLARQIEGVY